MAIEREIWRQDIVEALVGENPFLKYATNADEFVLAGKVVHIPQAGVASGVVKDRSSLPATVTQRTDVDITYAINEFTTNPVLIRNIDELQLSYDKRASVAGQDIAALVDLAGDWVLRNWAPSAAGNILRTLGADRAGEVNSTVTGTRKKFTKESILAVQKKMNKDNVPKKGRVLLLPSEFLSDLLEDTDLIKRDSGNEANYKEGVVLRLYGFDIMERSKVLTYTNAATPVVKDPGAAGAATDNAAALAWHPIAVEKAMGDVTTFENTNDPTYFGDIYSFLLMMGGRIRRSDAKGIYAIVEAAGA